MEEIVNMNLKKYLDLGSIILLKNDKKKLMIIGYTNNTENDYYGVLYPEGLIEKNIVFLINHTDIKEIIFFGYHTPISEMFLKKLNGHNINNIFSKIELINIDNKKNILPIGTIVFLKNTVNSQMIIGYGTNKEKEKLYYAVSYPTGIEESFSPIAFRNEDIDTIRFVGYENEKYLELCKYLNSETNRYEFKEW